MTNINPDCEPETFPCWQHYNSNYTSQPPTAWVINLATSLVDFRLREYKLNHDHETAFKIKDACHYLTSLLSNRWRNIVREPFDFHPYEGHQPINPEQATSPNQLLLALGLIKPQEPIKRRI